MDDVARESIKAEIRALYQRIDDLQHALDEDEDRFVDGLLDVGHDELVREE